MAPDSLGPLRVSVHRKIMLLLRDNMRHMDDYEVPEVLSQKGIGRELGLRQNHVSRALSELKDEGLVESRSARIKGVGRRRKIYFLTRKGESEIGDYLLSLHERRIPVRFPDRRLKSLRVPKVMDALTEEMGSRPSYYQLLNDYYDGSEVDLLAGKKGVSAQGPPISKHFFGREGEKVKLKEAIGDPGIPVVTVVSLAGMGKTTLMGKVVSEMRDLFVDWTNLTEWIGPERLFRKWSRHLASYGRTSLLDHLGKGGKFDLDLCVDKLLKDLRGLDMVIVLDDYQRSNDSVDKVLSMVMSRSGGFTFLIGSRERPPFYGKRDLMVTKKVVEIRLEGLDRQSSEKILKERGVPVQEWERVMDITKGHPLALELTAEAFLSDPVGLSKEVENYLGKELISGLEGVEREILYLAAAYEQPVVSDGLLLVKGSDRETLESLKERMILTEYPDGTMDLHDLIRDNVRKWMGEKLLDRYRDMALSHLSHRGSEREIIHYMILLRRAGRRKEMNRLILDMGCSLLETENSLVADHLRDMDPSGLSGLDRIKYLVLRADLDITSGRPQLGLKKLNEALVESDELTDDDSIRNELMELVSRVYTLKAEVCRTLGRRREEISNHLENVNRMRKHGSRAALGKALNNLALCYKNSGELNRAQGYLNEASVIFEETGDAVSNAFIHANLSEIMVMRRDIKGARGRLRIVDDTRVRSTRVEARLRRKTGLCRMRMKDWKEAMNDMKRSYLCSMNEGDRQGAALSVCDMLEISLRGEDRDSAVSNLESLVPFLYGDNDQKEIAWTYLRGLLSLEGVALPRKLLDGIDDSLRILVESEDPGTLIKGLEKYRDASNRKALNRTFEKSASLLRENGELHASVVVTLWLAEDLIDAGNKKKASKLIKRAKKDASRIDFKKAIRRSDELFKRIG